MVEVFTYRASNFKHIFQVGASILIGRSAHSTEHDINIIQDVFQPRREIKPSWPHIFMNQRFQPWLINWDNTLFKPVYLVLINVNTRHMDTHFTETSARDQADISSSYNGYSHWIF